MHNLWLVGLWTYQFLDISHIDWKQDEKRNKYGSILDKNGISRKWTEKPLFHFRKYRNGIPQIRKQTKESRKRNGSEQDFFPSVFNLNFDWWNLLVNQNQSCNTLYKIWANKNKGKLAKAEVHSYDIINKYLFDQFSFSLLPSPTTALEMLVGIY